MKKQNKFISRKITKGNENVNNKKESGNMNDKKMVMLTTEQMILLSGASKIFNLNINTVMMSTINRNVTIGLNGLIDAAKKEGCIGQTITEKIDISMEIGIILNLLNRHEQSNYTYKINFSTKTFSMKIICDEIRFTIVLSRNLVTYKLIISELDKSEISFDKQGEEETVVKIVGNQMTVL